MNMPADNFILELMMKTEETPLAEGQLEIYDAKSDMPVRQIKFSKAYITEFRETFNLLDDDRMTTYVKIESRLRGDYSGFGLRLYRNL